MGGEALSRHVQANKTGADGKRRSGQGPVCLFSESQGLFAVAHRRGVIGKRPSAREQAHSEPRRPENRPGGARRHFRRRGEQCAVAEGAKRDQEALRRREQPGWTRADGQSPGAGLWPDPGLPGVGGKPGVANSRGVTSSPQAPYPAPCPGGQVSLIALRLLPPPDPLALGSSGAPI